MINRCIYCEDIKEIVGFDSYYISKDGRIWSCRRNRWLTLCPSSRNDYLCVYLYKNGKRIFKSVHRLVLETFIGPCPDGMECCHNDGNPKNNKLDNLRWDTKISNQSDRKKHGTDNYARGEQISKLTEQDVRMIIYMYKTKKFIQQEIADVYNISRTTVSGIIRKKSWKHLWKD
jgi:hypothetical protein